MFSIVITVYEEYELLRQAYESILHHVHPDSYKEIIIVDDHSNPNGKLRRYLDYLSSLDRVKIIAFDEYRVGFHCSDYDLERMKRDHYSSKKKGFGHGYSLWLGIQEVTTDYVLCFDADSVMLSASKNMLYEMTDLFGKYGDIMAIGQLAGVMSHDLVTVGKEFVYYFGGRRSWSGGTPGSPAFACRMAGWLDHGIPPIADKPKLMSWVAGRYARYVNQKGFLLLNYPVFSRKMVFHIGGAVFKFTRPGRNPKAFGFCGDFTTAYGPRRSPGKLHDWYAGRYVLRWHTDKYTRHLRDKFSTPFEDMQEMLDENLLYTLDESEGPIIGADSDQYEEFSRDQYIKRLQ